MSENAEPGPVVVGFDGGPSGRDALALARMCSRVLGARMIVAVVHPAPAVISPARVDAEWVAEAKHWQQLGVTHLGLGGYARDSSPSQALKRALEIRQAIAGEVG